MAINQELTQAAANLRAMGVAVRLEEGQLVETGKAAAAPSRSIPIMDGFKPTAKDPEILSNGEGLYLMSFTKVQTFVEGARAAGFKVKSGKCRKGSLWWVGLNK